jgi:hypothetical protein
MSLLFKLRTFWRVISICDETENENEENAKALGNIATARLKFDRHHFISTFSSLREQTLPSWPYCKTWRNRHVTWSSTKTFGEKFWNSQIARSKVLLTKLSFWHTFFRNHFSPHGWTTTSIIAKRKTLFSTNCGVQRPRARRIIFFCVWFVLFSNFDSWKCLNHIASGSWSH